ncbi:hypothetical protein LCGC14_0392690 [marine sediment metagenome]|uniref:Uncharacterized protein n=1 Tax=marine sediment metagenome TaxID=412755 RepID=A0A0F9W7Y5_9ZZZZ
MGLTMPEFRAVLATDLKVTVDTEMTQAELNRSVQRAVDDLSRFLPLEKVFEETLSFTVTDESITTPAAASATYVVNAKTLNGESDGSTLTIANTRVNPPRRLTVTLTDANYSVTELAITVKGSDQDGHYIEETWSLPTLKVSGTAYQGNSYFSRITAVIVTRVAGSIAVGDTISVGTGNAYDSYISLANKPLRPETETVTSDPAGTTFTRDTDYTMDFINGAIKFINGGDMAAGTAYLVDYTKSRLGLDISSIIPVLTRISRVEYPVDFVPQQFVTFNVFGDFLYIASKMAGLSQEELNTSPDHMAVYYERKQMPPGEHSPGSYPDVLDEVIAIGAAGYALLTEAQQYEQQAATDLGSLRTELGLTTAIHTKVSAALVKVALYLETNDTTDNAKDVLGNITDDVTKLRTAIDTALNATNTYLDEVETTDLGKASVGAEAYTETGDDKIDAQNIGARVAEIYADYSRARGDIGAIRTNAALGYAQEAALRLSNLRSYIEEAIGGWAVMGQTFIAEGNGLVAEIQTHLAEAQQWSETINGDLVLSDRFRTEGLARLNEFHSILRNKAEYRKRTSSASLRQMAGTGTETGRHLGSA